MEPVKYKGYTVHPDGTVVRVERITTRSDGVRRKMPGGVVATRVRKAGKGRGGGYVYIDLHVMDEQGKLHVEHWLLHRLIATCFIARSNLATQVNHKDGVRSNNHTDNLEWVTPSENQLHAGRSGALRKDNLAAASERLGGSRSLVRDRVTRLGWSTEKALTTPNRRQAQGAPHA